MKSTLIAILILAGADVFAGNRVGNGGNLVQCEEPKGSDKKQLQLLDFYESFGMTGPDLFKLDPSKKDLNDKDILQNRLDLLAKVAPKLADQYSRRTKTIQNEIEFKTGVSLSLAKDAVEAFLPSDKGCSLKQVVIRKEQKPVDGEKRFLFDQTLWNKLNPEQKAGLMLHEIIYEHFAKLESKVDREKRDSRKARKLVAKIFSKDFEKLTSGEFWLYIKSLEVPVYP